MRNTDLPEFLHTLFACGLLLEKFLLTRHIAAIQFCGHVFAERTDIFTSNDVSSERGLYRNFEHVGWNLFGKRLADLTTARDGLVLMHHTGEGIDDFSIQQDVHLNNGALLIAVRFIVHRSVAMRDALEHIVEVNQDFVQRDDAGQDDACTVEAFRLLHEAAALHDDPHHVADAFARADDGRPDDGLFNVVDSRDIWQMDRIVNLHGRAIVECDLVHNGGMRADNVQIKFAAQTFLDHFHVQQAEEAAPEAKAQCDGAFRVEGEGRVVQMEFFKTCANLFIFVRADRIDTAEDHGVDFLEARQALGGAVLE